MEEYDNENWLGQMYYDIEKIEQNQGIIICCSVLNFLDNGMKMKIVEPIVFEKDRVNFGDDIFEDDNKNLFKYRVINITSFKTASTLAYNPDLNMIIYDNTITPYLKTENPEQNVGRG
ncbi:MAG: hypothetical protein R2771_16380 [Saprospiraceae bacterium]